MSARPLDLKALEAALAKRTPGTVELWDGCSWRRLGIAETGRELISPTNNRHDHHPDLAGHQEDMEAMVAAVNAADALIRYCRTARAALADVSDEIHSHNTQGAVDRIDAALRDLDAIAGEP